MKEKKDENTKNENIEPGESEEGRNEKNHQKAFYLYFQLVLSKLYFVK